MRTTIFFGLVYCAVLCAPMSAQQNPCQTVDRFNFGREWRSWSGTTRNVYMDGFMSGQADTYLALVNDLPAHRKEPLSQATFLFFDTDAIADVMTDLYKDPANAFIRFGAMVYIARDKLNGRDIEARLRYSREHDCGWSKK
jgi:hypothetical protein